MGTFIRHFALASIVLLATSLTGCVKFKQTMTLMPDGAGKMELSIGMSDQLIQMAKQQGEDPFKDIDPMELSKDCKGIVAFTKPTKTVVGGYTFLIFSAYFEDINAVELGSPDDGEDPATFSYKRDGKTAVFTVKDSMLLSAVENHEPMAEEEKAFAAQMLAGMMFTEVYVLPGTFEDIKGINAADNVATAEMDSNDMLNGTGPIEGLKGLEQLTFKITEVKEDDAAAKAFQAEMKAAIAEWEKMKAETGQE